MSDLYLDGVKKYLDTTLILKNVTFMVNGGEKAGIVGENGSGKTTILKLIAGIIKLNHCAGYPYAPVPLGYDEGWVVVPKGETCAYLDQIPKYPEGTKVIDVLNMAFEELDRIELEMRALEEEMMEQEAAALERTLKKYSNLVQLYEAKNGYAKEEKLNKICKGLHFADSFLQKDFNMLSGGEKTTVVLGKLLIDNPAILLLDEPTNHLDVDAVEWLEEYLRSCKGTVIIVSHDRYFLDHVVTKIVEIENKESKTYQGNYSEYIRLKEEEDRIQFENYKEQQKKINSMEKSIKELRDWAMRADNNKFFQRAASMQIRLDKMERIDKPLERQNMKLNFNSSERSGNIVIKAIDLCKSYGDKQLLKDANLLVNYGERVAFIGPNGSGKTTLLRILLGEEAADGGVLELGANVKAAYLPQSISFSNEEMTVLECFREDLFILEGKARECLAKFMFFGSNVFKKVKHLSGGERIRLKLSILLQEDINLLLLDEPTNHLDTASIETIEMALESFKGTIFFISHDRYFINKISGRIVALEEYALYSYDGNYEYYKEMREVKPGVREGGSASGQGMFFPGKSDTQKADAAKQNDKEMQPNMDRLRQKEAVRLLRTEAKKLRNREQDNADLMKRIDLLENNIKELDDAMLAPGLGYEELNSLYCKREDLARELDNAMERWMK